MKILEHSLENYPKELMWQVLAFMKLEWPFIFSGRDAYLTDSYPREQRPRHFSITRGDHLMSHGQLLEVEGLQADRSIPIYGMGNLFTFPPYRGRGMARAVVNTMMEHCRRSSMDMALLFCEDELVLFYEKLGWKVCNGEILVGNADSFEAVEGEAMAIPLNDLGHRILEDLRTKPLYVKEQW